MSGTTTATTPTPAIFTPGHPYSVGDIVLADVTTRPKWWQFWKQPVREQQRFVVTATGGTGNPTEIT